METDGGGWMVCFLQHKVTFLLHFTSSPSADHHVVTVIISSSICIVVVVVVVAGIDGKEGWFSRF